MPSLVSLVITVYNRENYLSIAVESILLQTYPHWQLTIWDDGSTDSSAEIAQHYANLDPRIRFIKANHAGQTHSLRAAMEIATGHRCLDAHNLERRIEREVPSRLCAPREGTSWSGRTTKVVAQASTRPSMRRYFGWVDSLEVGWAVPTTYDLQVVTTGSIASLPIPIN